MKIRNTADLGQLIRKTRRAQKLTQVDLAAFSGCGERFIVDLERGKPTCEFEKAIHIAQMLGISIDARALEERHGPQLEGENHE